MSVFALREPLVDDADWITEACQDTEITRWTQVPRPFERHDAIAFIAGEVGELHTWVIQNETTGQPAGVIAIHSLDGETGNVDVGYWIAPWARKQGAARAALDLVSKQAATLPGARAVTAQIAETNVASRATAEAAGFVLGEASATVTCPDGDTRATTLIYTRRL